ncbi:MAG: copper chaperone PCu(A)C [Gammaproteobacteria bacterium]
MRLPITVLTLLLAACGAPQPPVLVSELEITKPMPGRHMSAGYFVITNNTDESIHITSIVSPQFESVEIHETTVTNGISRMRELDSLLVPAQSSVTLERGGKHLMLMRPRKLEDSVSLQIFAGDVPVLTVDYSFLSKGEEQ